MKFELYNTTNKVKTVPKYRYNGVYMLKPYGTVDIEEFTTSFFKPYSKIGVVVRAKIETVESSEAEKSIGEEQKADEENETKEVVKEVKVEDVSIKEDISVETESEEPVVVTTAYSEDELYEKNMKELKEIASSMNLDITDTRKKDVLVKAILDAQN